MSDQSQHLTFKVQSVNEDRTSENAEPQVTIRQDGTVQLIYASYNAYARDKSLLKAAKTSDDQVADALSSDRLTSLPTELKVQIIKYVIPNRGRIVIGYDYYGMNTSRIQSGSLSISRVSKHLSEIALQVLYGYRWFRISAYTGYRSHDYAPRDIIRWNILRKSVDKTCPLKSPLDCFQLLIFHTPAHKYLTRLEVMINESLGEGLIDGKLLKALQYAKGLRLLELLMGAGTPDIMPFVHELGHIRTIKVFSWSRKKALYKTQVAKRNQNWEPPQAVGMI